MALLFAEHSVTVYPLTETADSVTKVVPVGSLGAGVNLSCMIEPIRAEVVIDSETGDELKNPYRIFIEPGDIAAVGEKKWYGARVVWNDTDYQFRVTKRPMRAHGGDILSDLAHGIAEMELLEYAT